MDSQTYNLPATDAGTPFQPAVESEAVASAAVSFPVIGIGASAGGLEALGAFFDHVPQDTGFAFVVVQHLSPDFRSLMDELLARHTKIPIHRVENGMAVEPNAIYLIPPRKEMIISGGKLLLTDKDPAQGLTLPIDTFFRSLAQDLGPLSVAIVLSGTGSDGSRGVRAIHEAGGLVIVQSEITAKFDGMPRSAIETGVADFVLPPEQIPQTLIRYAAQSADGKAALLADGAASLGQGIQAVIQLLRDEYGIDFSHYKPNTVLRRTERRLQLNQSYSLEDYIERLQHDSSELNALYRDLLIGVTRFFRDREAFERLERDVLAPLLARIPSGDDLRIWVAGCATGEEAYSLAILIHERCQALGRRPNVKIFATDVHRISLETASLGIYSEASLADVSPSRLERYFTRQGTGYQVAQDLRKMIVFAPHNLIKDAPFTKLDLITCRNLLIYFQPQTQKKVLSLLHFGLRTGGVLFLGPSETPGEIAEEFDAIDEHWKIYRKRRDVRLSADLRLPLTAPQAFRGGSSISTPTSGNAELQLLRTYDALLEEFMPPGFLLNERHEVVHTFGGAGKHLVPRDGRPSLQLLDLVHKDLKLALAGGLQRAAKEIQPVTYSGVMVEMPGGGEQLLDVTVKPVNARGENAFMLVTLQDRAVPAPPLAEEQQEEQKTFDVSRVSQEQLRALEEELRYTKENLQATVEEMETSNEELQATNEELVASNEELQSTNEELHSVNEELYTVNAEYQRKIVELTEMTDDMDNLLRSTDICVVFLDPELRIRKFTPAATGLFHITPADVGRRIDSFAHTIDYTTLLDDVAEVLQTHNRIEREVQGRHAARFLLRILPYRSKTRIDGAVLTLIDITRLRQAEEDLRLMSKVFMDAADAIIIEDLEGKILNVNAETERMYGYSRDELLGKSVDLLTPAEQHSQARALRDRCRGAEHVRNVESVRVSKSGQSHPVLLTLSLLTDERGKPLGIASIAKDITSRKQAEEDRQRYAEQLETTNRILRENVSRRQRAEDEAREGVRRRDYFLAMLSHELRNPLAAILNATYVMAEEAAHEGKCQDALQVIQRQSQHMARLLDDLLDVSRITQGKIEIRKESVKLNDLVQEGVQNIKSLADARSHSISVQLPDEPLYVHGDPARLLQIEENLLTNAIKYTERGGRIEVALGRDQDQAVLSVSDSGVGISPAMLNKIFEPFIQSNHSLDRSEGGMGVGLTLVRNLVALHDGTVEASSEGVGKGSRFEVRVPLRSAPEEPVSMEHHHPPLASGRNLKVLLVEDNDDSRHMLRILLQRAGFETCEAANGVDGVAAAERESPDVAIVDIGLPGMDGYQVARRLREQFGGRQLYLVAFTGYGQESDRRAVLDAGFDAHLVKPLRREELLQLLSGLRAAAS